ESAKQKWKKHLNWDPSHIKVLLHSATSGGRTPQGTFLIRTGSYVSLTLVYPDPDDQLKLTEDTRQLGLVVCRGTSVVLICPQDGMEAIPNPFIQQQDG
uniref:Uncharacterized protein n=1 Tax=Dicentrarchus labrax TaxID=13489 RepID=A0A8P4GGW6_DICLA